MPIDLRAWINPQSYAGSYSTVGIAREAAYFTPVPEPVTADPDWIAAEAREYEEAGYDSATIPQAATWPDVAITAAWALAHTASLTTVVAHRPGTRAPTTAARAIATLDRLSHGRTAVHLILGHEGDLARDGAGVDRAARYRRGAEYVEVFTRTLTSTEPFDFDGEFFRITGAYSGVTPVQRPRPLISTPGESPDAIELGVRHADVIAWQAIPRDAVRARVAEARAAAERIGRTRALGFWLNLNLLVGETDAAARDHLRELESGIRRLQAYRSTDAAPLRSIREDRFEESRSTTDDWQDDALYLGLTKLSRATPTLVGSPETIADSVLKYVELGVETVSLGGHVTNPRDAAARRETLRLIHQAVAARDVAAARDIERLHRVH